MACDTGAKPIEEKEIVLNNENNNEIKKEKNMSSSLVLRKAPEFKMDAYDSKTGHYTNASSEDYKGKWHVVCFYPADFTFVCPNKRRIGAVSVLADRARTPHVQKSA